MLAGAIVAPLALGFGFAGSGGREMSLPLLLYDGNLEAASWAARLARARGGAVRETGGEIAALLLREPLLRSDRPLLGITGYSEYLLAAEIARPRGRRLLPLMQLGRRDRWLGPAEAAHWRPMIEHLVQAGSRRAPQTAFAWLALPGGQS